MSGIIIYKSKYGSTKKYAEWLAEATGFDCVELSNFSAKDLGKYDIVVYGGGIYASGIAGISFIKKNYAVLSGKKTIVFCCGASAFDQKWFDSLRELNMKDELAKIPLYYCRGGCDLENMKFADRTLCKMLIKSLSKKDPKDMEVWETALVEAGQKKSDWTDRANLEPVIRECQTA